MISAIKKGLLVIVALLVIVQSISYFNNEPFLYSYTLSSSMEPTLNVGDVYFILPSWLSADIGLNDIIVFKINGITICHRVVGLKGDSYITRGDNSPFTDQQGGMPPINREKVIGKVLTFKNNPVLIPKLGYGIIGLQNFMGAYKTYVSFGILFIGLFFFVSGKEYRINPKVSRFRLRVKHILLASIIILVLFPVSIMLVKSGEVEIKYLASDSFTKNNIIKVGETVQRSILIENSGIIPMCILAKPHTGGIKLSNDLEFRVLMPGEKKTLDLSLTAKKEMGWYSEYVGVYTYLGVLPANVIAYIAGINPYLPIIIISLALASPLIVVYSVNGDNERLIMLSRSNNLMRIKIRFKNLLLN